MRRLSLLAGHGHLVREGADAALANDWMVQIIDLVGRDDMAPFQPVSASPRNPISIWLALRKFKPTHICMIGAVNLSDGDREGLAGFLRKRDRGPARGTDGSRGDGALSQLSRLLEFSTGAEVVGIHQIVDGLLAPEGLIAGPKLSGRAEQASAAAMQLARRASLLDAGQAVVTAGLRIIAVEDIAGTDALISRVGTYARDGLTGDGSDPLILAKCRKPDQPANIDLPAIGPDTVVLAAGAGIATIVVQAGQTLLISREQIEARAKELGVSVIGIKADDQIDA